MVIRTVFPHGVGTVTNQAPNRNKFPYSVLRVASQSREKSLVFGKKAAFAACLRGALRKRQRGTGPPQTEKTHSLSGQENGDLRPLQFRRRTNHFRERAYRLRTPKC